MIKKQWFVIFTALICLLSLTCAPLSLVGQAPKASVEPTLAKSSPEARATSTARVNPTRPANPIPGGEEKQGSFSPVVFCEDVSDDGECIGESDTFPADVTVVWAYFTYENMRDGQPWGRLWTQDGEIYMDEKDDTWQDGEQGWAAYSLEDPDGLSGSFTLTLFLGQKELQTAAFQVEAGDNPPPRNEQSGFPAFGPVTMAAGVTDENFPIGAARSFEPGVTEVYAIYAYANMPDGQPYTVQWVRDGKEVARNDQNWKFPGDGMYSSRLYDDAPLPSGEYTLNLYIDDQVVRAVNFEIQAEPTPVPQPEPPGENSGHPTRSASVEEVVEPGAQKYFYMVYNANLEVLKEVVKINLEHWTEVIITENNECGAGALACFSYSCDRRYGGKVKIPREAFNQADFKVAEILAHELTHGMEHYGGMKCGCTIEKEYYAFAAQIDYLLWSGNEDYAYSEYGKLWDDQGKVHKELLWQAVKKTYSDDNCPEY